MHNTSRCSEIDQRFPGLIAAIVKSHAIQSKARPPERGAAQGGRGVSGAGAPSSPFRLNFGLAPQAGQPA